MQLTGPRLRVPTNHCCCSAPMQPDKTGKISADKLRATVKVGIGPPSKAHHEAAGWKSACMQQQTHRQGAGPDVHHCVHAAI